MTSPAPQYIRFEDLPMIRDMYIPIELNQSDKSYTIQEPALGQAYAFTGETEGKLIFDGQDPRLVNWLINFYNASDAKMQRSENFRLEHNSILFRVHRQITVAGPELVIRAIPKVAPTLAQLNLPTSTRLLMMDMDLLYGGFVLICASNGQGKTTTASAMLKSRLEEYKGYAATVEDPPELPLHGWHGGGRCNQTPVTTPPGSLAGSGFAEALVNTRRYFPSITSGGNMLLIGEIRNAECAAETLLAANEGHLVIATFHGSSVVNAITRIASMAAERIGATQAQELLAGTLRLCVHQRLKLKGKNDTDWDRSGDGWDRGTIQTSVLSCARDDSALQKLIRDGSWFDLEKALETQKKALTRVREASGREEAMQLSEIKNALKNKFLT